MTNANLPPTVDGRARVVMLTFGQLDQGGMYWAYVAVVPSRYEEFKRLIAGKSYNMQGFVADGFGEIIVSGTGNLPPRDVTKHVAQSFNIPIRDLFADIDPLSEIAKELKKQEE